MRQVPADFTYNELMAFLRQSAAAGEEYRTRKEWAAHLGMGEEKMLKVLHMAKAAGALRLGRVERQRLDGISTVVSVYAFDLSVPNGSADKVD